MSVTGRTGATGWLSLSAAWSEQVAARMANAGNTRADRKKSGVASGIAHLCGRVAFRVHTSKRVHLVRDLLESEIAGARAQQRYGAQGHQHRGGDKDEHARHPGMFQDESDREAGEDRRKSAPRINEADGPRADAGREKLLLISMEGVGHHVVTERQTCSQQHDSNGAARLAEGALASPSRDGGHRGRHHRGARAPHPASG